MMRTKITFSKEMDDKLLNEISNGKTLIELIVSMKICKQIIIRRLKEMGFENFRDARNVMYLE